MGPNLSPIWITIKDQTPVRKISNQEFSRLMEAKMEGITRLLLPKLPVKIRSREVQQARKKKKTGTCLTTTQLMTGRRMRKRTTRCSKLQTVDQIYHICFAYQLFSTLVTN